MLVRLLAFVLGLYCHLSLAQPVLLSAEEKLWLSENKEVVVGGSHDFRPFNFVDKDGQYQGIANDYLKEISRLTGLKYRVSINTWQNSLEQIKNNELHILPSVYKTKERESFLNFSTPYFEALDYFFVHKDVSVSSFEDLAGKRLAIPKGYAHRQIISKHFPDIIFIDSDTVGGAIDLVLERKADLLFDTYGALMYILEQEGINTIIPFKSTRHLGKNPIHIVSSKKHPLLATIIQKGLDAIPEETHRKIYRHWFKEAPSNGVGFELTMDEKAWIQKHPVIKVAGDYAWAPFEFRNEQGMHDGLGHDLLQKIATLTGLKFHYTTDIWEKSLNQVVNKEKDLLVAVLKSSTRESNLAFSTP